MSLPVRSDHALELDKGFIVAAMHDVENALDVADAQFVADRPRSTLSTRLSRRARYRPSVPGIQSP